MMRISLAVVSAGALLVSWGLTAAATAEDFHCRLDGQLRRVELVLADDQDRLPCEVHYWRRADTPAEPQILWRADFNLHFCFDKARSMIKRLEDAGWRCGLTTPDTRSVEPAAAPPQPDDRALRLAVARDLSRLEKLVGNSGIRFDLAQSALGDLDGDAVADAAVLLDYQSERATSGRFLLAYVFRDDDFEPAAKAALGPDQQADLALSVDDGVIRLRPSAPGVEPRRPAAYVLQAGQLVPLTGSIADGAVEGPAAAGPGS